jgi:hypothetical protein
MASAQLADYVTADAYADAGTLGLAAQPTAQLRFSGYSNAYVVQLAIWTQQPDGKATWDDEEYVYAPNSGDVFGPEVAGARFRSANPGLPAQIYATLAFEGDPIASPVPPSLVPGQAPTPGSPYRIVMQNHHVQAAAHTPAALHTSDPCASIVIRADPTNVGLIYIGNSTVNAPTGYWLSPGDAIAFAIGNANLVWVDADNAGDGVSWLAVG